MFSAWTTRSPGGPVLRNGHPVAAWLTDVLAKVVRPSGRWALDVSRDPVGRSRRPAVILSANDVASPAMLPALNVLFEVLDLGPLTEGGRGVLRVRPNFSRVGDGGDDGCFEDMRSQFWVFQLLVGVLLSLVFKSFVMLTSRPRYT
ncbi:unnamed protein product [Caenorhabditis auriculariae]|uniref:Uncharacterized protein n=1 Tax=Caenorhabditis auriculariae TaxID=2777116 RepID=A0A8S1H4C5_9PELO|nr:unnamed protein product [Caenorhabditis auriculariae]